MSLFEQAKKVRANAYAPYSKFNVGVALRSASGAIFTGCNVENAAYPEGTCAEAGAIAAMAAAGERVIVEILVMADADTPVTPCGGCRQKISEFATGDAVVIIASPRGEQFRTTVADLLPGSFGLDQLPKDQS